MAADDRRPSRLIVLADLSMAGKRTGYSLAEVIIVVLIIGAMAFIAVPRLNFGVLYRQKAHTVAKTIVTDLRRTRTLAITKAATNPTGYSLRITGSTYQIIDDSNSATVGSQTIDSHISCGGDTQFLFGPLGNLRDESGDQLTVSDKDVSRTYTITVIRGTGIVECTGG
jgi:Tfp pilus assembly protein FimT